METEQLSFVSREKGGALNFWALDASSLDYGQQNKLGQIMAQELLANVRETGETPYLGWVIFDWLAAQQPRGVDVNQGVMIGFCDEVAAIAAGFSPLIQRV